MLATAIGGFDQDVVRARLVRRVPEDGGPGPAQVAGEDDDALGSALIVLHADPDDRGAQDVARVEQGGPDPWRHFALALVLEGLEAREHGGGVLLGVEGRVEVAKLGRSVTGLQRGEPPARVARADRLDAGRDVLVRGEGAGLGERNGHGIAVLRRGAGVVVVVAPLALAGQLQGRRVLGKFAAVIGLDLVRVALLPARLALGEFLVEAAAVQEDEGRQLGGTGGGVDVAAVPLADQHRQEAAVIQVGVGDQHGVQGGGVVVERDPVPDGFVRRALEHAAIDEDAGPPGDQEILGAGDGLGATKEVEVHVRHGDTFRRACRRQNRAAGLLG